MLVNIIFAPERNVVGNETSRAIIQTDMRDKRFPVIASILLIAATAICLCSWLTWGTSILGAGVSTQRGVITITRVHMLSSYIPFPPEPSWRNAGGFTYARSRLSNGIVLYEILALPIYPLPVLAAVLFAWSYRRQRRGSIEGLCPACGYDLRATPGRCPECGLVAIER